MTKMLACVCQPTDNGIFRRSPASLGPKQLKMNNGAIPKPGRTLRIIPVITSEPTAKSTQTAYGDINVMLDDEFLTIETNEVFKKNVAINTVEEFPVVKNQRCKPKTLVHTSKSDKNLQKTKIDKKHFETIENLKNNKTEQKFLEKNKIENKRQETIETENIFLEMLDVENKPVKKAIFEKKSKIISLKKKVSLDLCKDSNINSGPKTKEIIESDLRLEICRNEKIIREHENHNENFETGEKTKTSEKKESMDETKPIEKTKLNENSKHNEIVTNELSPKGTSEGKSIQIMMSVAQLTKVPIDIKEISSSSSKEVSVCDTPIKRNDRIEMNTRDRVVKDSGEDKIKCVKIAGKTSGFNPEGGDKEMTFGKSDLPKVGLIVNDACLFYFCFILSSLKI